MAYYIVWAAAVLFALLDLFGIFRVTAKFGAGIILIFAPHIFNIVASDYGRFTNPVAFFLIYAFIRLNIFPIQRHRTASVRLNFLFGGKRLLNLGIYTMIIQLPMYILYLVYFERHVNWFWTDIAISWLLINIIVYNGMFRVILSSKWLNVIKRIACVLLIWMPVLNIVIALYLRHIASKEFDYFVYKLDDMPHEVENRICATKYPIMLVHGVGFRDTRYFNYWGRIPKQLRKRGARIFYGNQEAWATTEHNSELLYGRVKQILAETGAGKINIIAHSKGGLDCRRMICRYNLDCVATLTTMGTPHHGVRFADVLLAKLSDGFVDKVSASVNRLFASYGDSKPDFKSAVYSLTEAEMAKFNAEIKDCPNTYYQSYSSVMGCMFSDLILTIPYIIGRMAGSRYNDGLVPEPSAHWGKFREKLSNKRLHGISHGDLIDLKREDYRGFDMIDKYVEIVSELKDMGY